jgi:hypothetical protein
MEDEEMKDGQNIQKDAKIEISEMEIDLLQDNYIQPLSLYNSNDGVI